MLKVWLVTSTLSTDADWLVDALSGIGRIMGCLKSHFTHHDLVTSTKEDPRAHSTVPWSHYQETRKAWLNN